jgi:hypothetical protein
MHIQMMQSTILLNGWAGKAAVQRATPRLTRSAHTLHATTAHTVHALSSERACTHAPTALIQCIHSPTARGTHRDHCGRVHGVGVCRVWAGWAAQVRSSQTRRCPCTPRPRLTQCTHPPLQSCPPLTTSRLTQRTCTHLPRHPCTPLTAACAPLWSGAATLWATCSLSARSRRKGSMHCVIGHGSQHAHASHTPPTSPWPNPHGSHHMPTATDTDHMPPTPRQLTTCPRCPWLRLTTCPPPHGHGSQHAHLPMATAHNMPTSPWPRLTHSAHLPMAHSIDAQCPLTARHGDVHCRPEAAHRDIEQRNARQRGARATQISPHGTRPSHPMRPHPHTRWDATLAQVESNAEVQRVLGVEGEDWRHVPWSRTLLTEADQIHVVVPPLDLT